MTDAPTRAVCPWTGTSFAPVRRGAHEKKFASPADRAEAHKAARLYAEHLIEEGFLTWAELRRWYVENCKARPSCTTAGDGKDCEDGY